MCSTSKIAMLHTIEITGTEPEYGSDFDWSERDSVVDEDDHDEHDHDEGDDVIETDDEAEEEAGKHATEADEESEHYMQQQPSGQIPSKLLLVTKPKPPQKISFQ